ncbi:MAG TPA: hypothetical protein VFF27_12370 [Bacteroidia bacterium]|nr:hypothetical protein [Bacteroidia bacterium]
MKELKTLFILIFFTLPIIAQTNYYVDGAPVMIIYNLPGQEVQVENGISG